MEELYEFDITDVDVAAFENVGTCQEPEVPQPETQPPQQPEPEPEPQHEPEPKTEPEPQNEPEPEPQLQPIPVPIQTTQPTAHPHLQRPCKILLIPIPSQIPRFHNQQQQQQQQHHEPPPPQHRPPTPPPPVTTITAPTIAVRKPCNCTKSQCLKLYCDCFANGEFCSGCNCTNCSNSLDKEKERQKAITQCLERNPEAFRPKIGKAIEASIERRHTKGCNCKRSGCLKNYCECYEAKILCSNLCKCCGCKNYEESFERKTLVRSTNASTESARGILKTLLPKNRSVDIINLDVINASLHCLLQSAQEAEKESHSPDEIRLQVQKEMSKCLKMIVNLLEDSPKKALIKY